MGAFFNAQYINFIVWYKLTIYTFRLSPGGFKEPLHLIFQFRIVYLNRVSGPQKLTIQLSSWRDLLPGFNVILPHVRSSFCKKTHYFDVSCVEILLVSTYIVCERLSVMHEPAGVVEILVQILPEYPYSELGTEYPPPQWKLSESPNPRVSEYPPQNENCQRVQIWEFQNTPPPQWKLSESPSPRVSEYLLPKWKLSESPNQRVSEYPRPKWKLSESPNLRVSEYPPPQWKFSESPNLRVSEYPPKMKIVRVQIQEFQNTPTPNENCQRVQIREFQNTPPPNENCQRVQIREFQNTPPNENCHRVQVWEFQNTPLPPKLEKLQISNFRSLAIW